MSTLFCRTVPVIVLMFAAASAYSFSPPDSIPGLKTVILATTESRVLPGTSKEPGRDGVIDPVDIIGDLGLGALLHNGYAYTNGEYNNLDYKVDKGIITIGKLKVDGYTIHPAKKKASKFLASGHGIFFRFKTKEDYNLYVLKGTVITTAALIPAAKIQPNVFTKLEGTNAATLESTETYFVAPASVKINLFTELGPGTMAARIQTTPIGKIYKYRYSIDGKPPEPSTMNIRQFFPVKDGTNTVKAIWKGDGGAIFLTSTTRDLKGSKTIALPGPVTANLIAATMDPQGNSYYALVITGGADDKLVLYKAAPDGKLLVTRGTDTSKDQLDFFRWNNYMADMTYKDGALALMVARTMHRHSDGLNHQGGIAVIFNSKTLAMIHNFGQTSGHSFDNFLTTTDSAFLGVDLGDNYPRGVHLHQFDTAHAYLRSNVVYTFKTEHGTSAKSPAGRAYPEYKEISSRAIKYYQWSNDNATYTELGGVVSADDGHLVFFAGEPDDQGRSIQNSRVNEYDTRNLGFVKVKRNFGDYSSDPTGFVISEGVTEAGGFYSFGGTWSDQKNVGISWLTKYKTKEEGSVRFIKVARVKKDVIILLWENASNSKSYAIKLNDAGKVIVGPIELSEHVRLNRRDNVLVSGNGVLIFSGDPVDQRVELVQFEMK